MTEPFPSFEGIEPLSPKLVAGSLCLPNEILLHSRIRDVRDRAIAQLTTHRLSTLEAHLDEYLKAGHPMPKSWVRIGDGVALTTESRDDSMRLTIRSVVFPYRGFMVEVEPEFAKSLKAKVPEAIAILNRAIDNTEAALTAESGQA